MNKKGMGMTLTLLGMGLFCLSPANGKAPRPQPEKQAMQSFFSAQLKGEESKVYEESKTLKWSDIASWQAEVWDAWKQANGELEEDKLPQPGALTKENNYSWRLPENLEPNATLPFYYGKKDKEGVDGKYPFYLYLHGSGPKASEWETGLMLCQKFDDAPSVYFIPQIPNEGKYYRWWQQSKQFAWNRLIRQTLLNEQIDPNRLYVFGVSEGAYGSQRMASFYADYLAAAGPMAGGEPLKNAPAENCANIGFSLLTGANDKMFYRDYMTYFTEQRFDSLRQVHPLHYNYRVELIPGMGHQINYFRTTPWLKRYIRNPYPKYVSWEDFPMDSLYRSGFYNLAVKERSDAERMYYEMQIEGNKITLEVKDVVYKTVQRDERLEIDLTFNRAYTPAQKGKFIVYLNDLLVDLKKEVELIVNGKQVFKGKLKADLKHMVNSCATFYDPMRLYPAGIEVDLSKL